MVGTVTFVAMSIILILIVIQPKANGLNCYHCAFGRDGCGPSFNSKGSGVIQQSSSTYTYCVKQVYSSNNNAVSRDGSAASACSAGTITVTPSTSGSINDGYTVYCCNTDLCNGSYIQSASVMFAILAAALNLFFF